MMTIPTILQSNDDISAYNSEQDELEIFMMTGFTTSDNNGGGGSDGFEWDWDGWYVIGSFILIFVSMVVLVTYCICVWYPEWKYKPKDPEKSNKDNYTNLRMTRAPSFSESELGQTKVVA